MTGYPIDVSADGAVLLGGEVACDGFVYGRSIRVQTHVHDDHMEGFESSKGFQEILASEGTHALLLAEFDADLLIRENVRGLQVGTWHEVAGTRVLLESAGHMLGATQVVVELAGGERLGYSGDFGWPLEKVIRVDALVLDSTGGSPARRRTYHQEVADEEFLKLVRRGLRRGPVHVMSHRGTLHRGLRLLACEVDCPVVGSARLLSEAAVYHRFGYDIGNVVDARSAEGRDRRNLSRFVQVWGKGDRPPNDELPGITINLSAYMTQPDNPVVEYSERAYSVALTDHADFDGTLDYVSATGARCVLTDNSRGGHAVELAQELARRLGIEAKASEPQAGHFWGT